MKNTSFALLIFLCAAGLILSPLSTQDGYAETFAGGKISTEPFTGGLNLWQLEFRGPVEVHIYAPGGRHTGHTGKYQVDRDIKEVQYSRFEDFNGFHTTIFTPLRPDYKVKFKSVGSGTFSCKIRKLQKTKVVSTRFYDWVPVSPEATGWIDLTPEGGPGDLHLARNVPGSYEQVITPDHFFDGHEVDDEIPPTTKAYITAIEEVPYVFLTLDAWDNKGGSGVSITAYSYDKKTWLFYKRPLILKGGCKSTLYYYSVDYGHLEEPVQSIDIGGCP